MNVRSGNVGLFLDGDGVPVTSEAVHTLKRLGIRLWLVLTTPVFVLVDWIAYAWMGRRGYVQVENWALTAARAAIAGALDYTDRSGHLNTVKGRKPRAVKRLTSTMDSALLLSTPRSPGLGRGARPPLQELEEERRKLLTAT